MADEDLAQQSLFREEMNAQWREIQQTLSRQSHTEIVRQHKQMAAEITKLSNDIDGKMLEPCLFPPVPGTVAHVLFFVPSILKMSLQQLVFVRGCTLCDKHCI